MQIKCKKCGKLVCLSSGNTIELVREAGKFIISGNDYNVIATCSNPECNNKTTGMVDKESNKFVSDDSDIVPETEEEKKEEEAKEDKAEEKTEDKEETKTEEKPKTESVEIPEPEQKKEEKKDDKKEEPDSKNDPKKEESLDNKIEIAGNVGSKPKYKFIKY